jgi:hypothetical protein
VVTSPLTGGVDEAPVSDDEFALSGFPEFVRSGDGFGGTPAAVALMRAAG